MTRRNWMAIALVGGATACRKAAAPTGGTPAWTALDDHGWRHAMGGDLTFPGPGVLRLGWGESLSAAKWTGAPVTVPFEVELEARRIDGTDFFCGLTFPARSGGECLTWIVGGWGGSLVGISSIDGLDAAANEAKVHRSFERERWYRLRLRRDGERVEAWIDGERVIDLDTNGKALSLRPGPIDATAPFGLATWQSTGEFKGLQWRPPVR